MDDKDTTMAKPASAATATPTPSPTPTPTPPPAKPDLRLVVIASFANPKLLVSAVTYPQAANGPITFDLERPDTKIQPFSWWVLHPVTPDRKVFQILFHPSDGNLCLTAGTGAAPAPATLAAVDPTNQLQLWELDESASGPQLISSYSNSKQSLGYANDIPLKGLPLLGVISPDKHERGDVLLKSDDGFLIRDVVI